MDTVLAQKENALKDFLDKNMTYEAKRARDELNQFNELYYSGSESEEIVLPKSDETAIQAAAQTASPVVEGSTTSVSNIKVENVSGKDTTNDWIHKAMFLIAGACVGALATILLFRRLFIKRGGNSSNYMSANSQKRKRSNQSIQC